MFIPRIVHQHEVTTLRSQWLVVWDRYTRSEPDLLDKAQYLINSPLIIHDLNKRFIPEEDRLRVVLSSLAIARYALGKEVLDMMYEEGAEEFCTATVELIFRTQYNWDHQHLQMMLLCTMIIRLSLHTVAGSRLTSRCDDLLTRLPIPEDFKTDLRVTVGGYIKSYSTHTLH